MWMALMHFPTGDANSGQITIGSRWIQSALPLILLPSFGRLLVLKIARRQGLRGTLDLEFASRQLYLSDTNWFFSLGMLECDDVLSGAVACV